MSIAGFLALAALIFNSKPVKSSILKAQKHQLFLFCLKCSQLKFVQLWNSAALFHVSSPSLANQDPEGAGLLTKAEEKLI